MTDTTTQNTKPVRPSYRRLNYLAATIIVIGILAILIAGNIAENYWQFVGLLIIAGFASCLCGVLLGFLFGIPKLNKNYAPREDYKTLQKYDPNTNLEDISDWLTKIIVGVSLTQLTKIPSAFKNIADYVLLNNHCRFTCDYAKPIIISMIIFFLITGFLIGYFYTRLLLPKLLNVFDNIEFLENNADMWKQSYKKVTETNTTSNADTTNLKTSSDISVQTKIRSLTEKEIEIIKLILSKNNEFIIESLLDMKSFSAINVLLEKGIISIIQGNTIRTGATLSVVDKEIIEKYQKK